MSRKNAHIPGLVWTLIRTDLKTRYHGSVGGYLWTLLKPLTMFAVLLGVFSFVFRTDPDYRLNLLLGLFLWDYFASSTRTGVGSLHAKGFLLTKARFPAWTVVLTSSVNALVNLVLFAVILCLYVTFFKEAPALVEIALFVLYLAALWCLTVGISLATSVLYLRFRDLNEVWDLTLQVGFFVAPVIYPLHILPERVHLLLYAWFPTPIIQFSREVLVAGTVPTWRAHLCLVAMTVAVVAAGAAIFRLLLARAVEEL